MLYGTQNGKMGLVKLTPTEPNYRWDMLNERKYGGISCISTWDITGDGVADIIVGRDDGVVEVYGFEDSDEPRLQFTHVSPVCVCVCGGGCRIEGGFGVCGINGMCIGVDFFNS